MEQGRGYGGEGRCVTTGFPNKAGDHENTDEILIAELRAAGISVIGDDEPISDNFKRMLRDSSGEVKTWVIGFLHGWELKRAWYYWRCKGPGIEVAAADRLHEKHGRDVCVDGHCGCPSPREWFKGLACGHYHVDSP